MKVVINTCFGGFCVSRELYKELGLEWDGYGFINNNDLGIESGNYLEYRTDPHLIAAIEKLGLEKSSGECADLYIVEIPNNVDWEITEYDGNESVRERSRTFY